jgi:hypothetical protein
MAFWMVSTEEGDRDQRDDKDPDARLAHLVAAIKAQQPGDTRQHLCTKTELTVMDHIGVVKAGEGRNRLAMIGAYYIIRRAFRRRSCCSKTNICRTLAVERDFRSLTSCGSLLVCSTLRTAFR